ncbi:Peroxidase 20 [Hibiscus syriacus]|uniref:Peroxidase n=1 Tax=Hibiscus syriacus TaxID=106335 RepID=A0A6A2XFP9_HIBSY|nr:Peroxidase 20 [Hibiscus syriacus]
MEITRAFCILLVSVLNAVKITSSVEDGLLYLDYYKETCPLAAEIVSRNVEIAVLKDPRMAASLLRLHFHDCFVMGCDASILLDNNGDIISEKQAGPNLNSLRGFEVIDKIKHLLEEACPLTVSCADILAMVARDSVTLRGGPSWEVWLGRKDSLKASFDGANQFIPTPNSSLETLIANFNQQGLDVEDLVALSEKYDKYQRYRTFRRILRSICPESGRDEAIAPLDFLTPAKFDNQYYINIHQGNGLLGSDNVLVNEDHEGEIKKLVWDFASDQELFFSSFAKSVVKMGNINVLTGIDGEIRKNCRFVNP